MRPAFPALYLFLLAGSATTQEDEWFELHDRSIGIRSGGEYAAQVGRLRVQEVRSDPDGGTIRLAFVRLLSTAEDPGPPLFLLPGGPGNAAVPTASSPAWRPYLELGDVVLADPRGVGESEPDLEWGSDAIRPELFFADRETAVQHMGDMCAAAREELAGRGIDVAGYTPIEMADDVAELAAALGYERVNLMGHSYGTFLGLAILERHPELVARFVSIGTAGTGDMMKLPSELDASLRALSELVAEDPVVGPTMPDLEGVVKRVVADLEAEPLVVPLRNANNGATLEFELGPFGAQLILVADLGDTSDLPVYPRLLHSLEMRDPSVVAWFLAKRMRQFSELPVMMLAVRGAAGADAKRWKRIRREAKRSPFGLARCLFSPESDEALGVRDVGDAFRRSFESKVPTLFVSGTLDAHTPPEQAERVREGLPDSGHVIVEYGGHEDLIPDPEVQERILAFLAGDDPEDAFIEREPLRFVPLEGPTGGFDHPSL